jgi:hypothetical protein
MKYKSFNIVIYCSYIILLTAYDIQYLDRFEWLFFLSLSLNSVNDLFNFIEQNFTHLVYEDLKYIFPRLHRFVCVCIKSGQEREIYKATRITRLILLNGIFLCKYLL